MGSRKNANSRNSSLQLLIQKFQTKNQPQKTDISKQHSKQARTEIRNYEMFANPVFINPSVNKLQETFIKVLKTSLFAISALRKMYPGKRMKSIRSSVVENYLFLRAWGWGIDHAGGHANRIGFFFRISALLSTEHVQTHVFTTITKILVQ